MNAAIDPRAKARTTIVGIQLGEIVKVTQHQHSWRNPFERRRATSLPEDFMLERPLNPSPLVEAVIDLGFAEAAARQD